MRKSLLGLGVAVTIVPVAVMGAFIVLMGDGVVGTANKQFRSAASECAKQAVADIRQMCDIVEKSGEYSASAMRDSVLKTISDMGEVSLSDYVVKRYVRNQDNAAFSRERATRLLKLGSRIADPASLNDKSNAIDKALYSLKRRFDCDFSLLVKMEDSNDMLRVATTLVSEDGGSLVGTYIPAVSDDGRSNPVVAAMLEDREYSGVTYIEGYAMLSNYIPLKNAAGKLVGAVLYGGNRKAMSEIEKLLKTFPVGDTGSVLIADVSDPKNPVLRMNGRESSDGDAYLQTGHAPVHTDFYRNAAGRFEYMRAGEIAADVVSFAATDKKTPSVKIIAYTYYAPWSWFIMTVSDAAEYSRGGTVLADRTNLSARKIAAVGVLFAVLAGVLACFFASKIVRPVKALIRAARAHSNGDLSEAENILEGVSAPRGKAAAMSEFSEIASAIVDMTRALSSLMASVGDDVRRISSNVSDISQVSGELEKISDNENTSVRRVVRTETEISAYTNDIMRAAKVSANGADAILSISKSGGESLALLKKNYDSLEISAENVLGKLSLISENAEKITDVASTINDVSRRVNLLSLNASVEAEKAGKSGLGFAVLARQIRKIADNISRTSGEMEGVVGQLCASINSGNMEMDRFDSRVRQSSRVVAGTADSLARIISDIEKIGPKFESIISGASQLAFSVRGVGAAMKGVEKSMEEAVAAAGRFKQLNAGLDASSRVLFESVSRFKIPPNARRNG